MEETERDCCIRGYHVYKYIWEATVRESLTCERETNNSCDTYAVAVKKSETVIGHLPRKVARLYSSSFCYLRARLTALCWEAEGTPQIYLKVGWTWPWSEAAPCVILRSWKYFAVSNYLLPKLFHVFKFRRPPFL